MKVLNLKGCCQEQKNNLTEYINDNHIICREVNDDIDLLRVSDEDAEYIDNEDKFENYDHVITDYTYDVEFNDENNTNSKGWKASYQYCREYIDTYNGTDESYFKDYKDGTVSIRSNYTGEIVYEIEVK